MSTENIIADVLIKPFQDLDIIFVQKGSALFQFKIYWAQIKGECWRSQFVSYL